MASRTKKIDFEANIAALQELVEKMERGDFTLEESVTQFEHGMALAKNCQLALREAEVKVSTLMKSAQGGEKLVPLDGSDKDDA